MSVIFSDVPERQREVWVLVRKGLSNPAIAQTMGISINTVRMHLRALYLRTGAPNRVSLATRVMDTRGH